MIDERILDKSNNSIEEKELLTYCKKFGIKFRGKEVWRKIINHWNCSSLALSNYGRLMNLDTFNIYTNKKIANLIYTYINDNGQSIGINITDLLIKYKYRYIDKYIKEVKFLNGNCFDIHEDNLKAIFARDNKSEWKPVINKELKHVVINKHGELANTKTGYTLNYRRLKSNILISTVSTSVNNNRNKVDINIAKNVAVNFLGHDGHSRLIYIDGNRENVSYNNLTWKGKDKMIHNYEEFIKIVGQDSMIIVRSEAEEQFEKLKKEGQECSKFSLLHEGIKDPLYLVEGFCSVNNIGYYVVPGKYRLGTSTIEL